MPSASRSSSATTSTIRGSIRSCASKPGGCAAGSTSTTTATGRHHRFASACRRVAIPLIRSRGGIAARGQFRCRPAPRRRPAIVALTIPLAAVLLIAIAAMVFWLGSRDRHPPPDLRPTAAVLPFEANMIGGDNSNYSALITEAVTSELARLGTISVASYTSAMQFEGQRRPMSEIAAALKSALRRRGLSRRRGERDPGGRADRERGDGSKDVGVGLSRRAGRCPRHRATNCLRRERGDPGTRSDPRHPHRHAR